MACPDWCLPSCCSWPPVPPGPAEPAQLAYAAYGAGPAVVLLHGRPQTAASWRAHLRGAFAPYEELAAPAADPGRFDVPVLAVGGEHGVGNLPADSLQEVADDVTAVVLPGATHWLAEEHPAALLTALEPLLVGS